MSQLRYPGVVSTAAYGSVLQLGSKEKAGFFFPIELVSGNLRITVHSVLLVWAVLGHLSVYHLVFRQQRGSH